MADRDVGQKHGELIFDIERRIRETKKWLVDTAPECFNEQKHIVKGTSERIYWHYGYLMALRDVHKRMTERANA
jgi:hypothetical protein